MQYTNNYGFRNLGLDDTYDIQNENDNDVSLIHSLAIVMMKIIYCQKKSISNALLINLHIKSREDVAINKDLDKLNITCIVNIKYGDIYVKI